jgi:hypothetical protein
MKIRYIIFTVLLLTTCNKTVNEPISILSDDNEIVQVDKVEQFELNNPILSNIMNFGFDYNETSISPYNGKIYSSEIIFDDVNVYRLPDINSEIINTLIKSTKIYIIGISEKFVVDGQEECWVNIHYGEDRRGNPLLGWILCKYTDIEIFFISYLTITNSGENRWGSLVLSGTYSINGIEKEFSVLTNKLENQDFYVFCWDYSQNDFHYSNKPGLYIWYEDSKILEHISYIGGAGSYWGLSSWQYVTYDFKYLIQDYGTNIPPRGFNVWNLQNGEIINSGSYGRYIKLREHTIIRVVKWYNRSANGVWSNRQNSFNEEEIIFAENFIKNNEPPDVMYFSFYILFEYDLETMDYRIYDGIYLKEH